MKTKFQYHGELEVHGIQLDSRHGRLNELREMVAFAELAHARGLARYVESVFYDSNGAVAKVKFRIKPKVCDPVFCATEIVALRTLSCFELETDDEDGGVQHGRGFDLRPGAPIPLWWQKWAR